VHCRVHQRFHEQKDIGGTGAADGGSHIQRVLVGDVHLRPHRPQDSSRLGALQLGHRRRSGPDGHALPDLSWRVGHGAHDGGMVEPGANDSHGHARDDGKHDRRGLDVTAQFGQHRGQHLGLDREDHDIRLTGSGNVIGGDAHTVPISQFLAPLRTWPASDDLLWSHFAGAQQRLDHRLGHRPTADESQCQSMQCISSHFRSSPFKTTRSRSASERQSGPPRL